jgi:hypothetical protein
MKQIDIEKTLSVIKASGVCEITRKRDMVYKRIYAAVFLRKNTLFSLEKIGFYIGGKDHTTILHYLKIYKDFKNDSLFKMYTKEIADQLNDCFIFGEKKQPLSWLEYAVINCANVKELREIQLKVLDKVENDVEYFELDESLILG